MENKGSFGIKPVFVIVILSFVMLALFAFFQKGFDSSPINETQETFFDTDSSFGDGLIGGGGDNGDDGGDSGSDNGGSDGECDPDDEPKDCSCTDRQCENKECAETKKHGEKECTDEGTWGDCSVSCYTTCTSDQGCICKNACDSWADTGDTCQLGDGSQGCEKTRDCGDYSDECDTTRCARCRK